MPMIATSCTAATLLCELVSISQLWVGQPCRRPVGAPVEPPAFQEDYAVLSHAFAGAQPSLPGPILAVQRRKSVNSWSPVLPCPRATLSNPEQKGIKLLAR